VGSNTVGWFGNVMCLAGEYCYEKYKVIARVLEHADRVMILYYGVSELDVEVCDIEPLPVVVVYFLKACFLQISQNLPLS
jgi:hypothetical protein